MNSVDIRLKHQGFQRSTVMTLPNSDPSNHSDRISASQAFLDSLVALDETFGDIGLLDAVPDLSPSAAPVSGEPTSRSGRTRGRNDPDVSPPRV